MKENPRPSVRNAIGSLAVLLIPVAILLAGCTSDQQLAKDNRAAAEAAAKQTGAIDDARCRSYGFQPGSPNYDQCRADIDSGRKQMDVKE